MRKLLFGLFGFAALGFGALSAQPASAQPYYPGYRHDWGGPAVTTVQYYGRPYYGRPYYRPYRPYYRPYRPYGYYARPVYGPRCVVRVRNVWNGYRWVQRRVRTCRY